MNIIKHSQEASIFNNLLLGTRCVMDKAKDGHKFMIFKKLNSVFLNAFAFLCLFHFLTSCTYSTPEAVNPTPGLLTQGLPGTVQNGVLSIRKSFFGIIINQNKNTWKNTRKTWLCGWAPVHQSGIYKNAGVQMAASTRSTHCNMEFHISKDGLNLEAREIDVNSDNYEEDYQLIFTLPIIRHYFYEKVIDSRGRKQNKYEKITDKKNWMLSPIIDIDLQKINFLKRDRSPGLFSKIINGLMGLVSNTNYLSAYDVEMETGPKNFLGFSALYTSSLYGSDIQNEVRFNFLEMKPTSGFTKTPYHPSTARHMNILHILGSKTDGYGVDEYAAHWDLSKPIEVCLNGFPDDSKKYKNIAIDVLEEMNSMFSSIKATQAGQKAFVVSKKKYKYPFDLRCPSITWVEDYELSLNAPLGIGLTNTNIKTGEILWGGAVIWGGLIDRIVNQYNSSVGDQISANLNSSLQSLPSLKHHPDFIDINSLLGLQKWSPGFQYTPSHSNIDMSQYSKIRLLKNYDLSDFPEDMLQDYNHYNVISEQEYIEQIKMHSNISEVVTYNSEELEFRNAMKQPESDDAMKLLTREMTNLQSSIYDTDNLLKNHYHSWQSATSFLNNDGKSAAARSILKMLMLHEWGHVVGLGHQFEANRLPERGTVPDEEVFQPMHAASLNNKNYSSVMDYMSGFTQVNLDYKTEIKLQVQDKLVLKYLYKQEYSTFRAGDEQFTFFPLTSNGLVPAETVHPENGLIYRTRYMPQCSDIEAWLATSPYCKRFDRGFDAPSIVEENNNQYKNSFTSRMNSFTTASGGNPYFASKRLWKITYNLMNNNRTFYDHLRYTLTNNKVYKLAFDKIKASEEALLSFSKSCINPGSAAKEWQLTFAQLALKTTPKLAQAIDLPVIQSQTNYEQLLKTFIETTKDVNFSRLDNYGYHNLENSLYKKGIALTEVQKLCRATQIHLEGVKSTLSLDGSDHSEINYENSIIPTGIRGGNAQANYSTVWGRFEKLGFLPIKLAILESLTSFSSTMKAGYWQILKPKFSNSKKGKFAYYPLYPIEFSEIINTSVIKNMNFGNTPFQDTATLSIANLYMPYFLNRTFIQGKALTHGFNEGFIKELQNQTKFTITSRPVAVMLETITGDKGPSIVYGFKGRVFKPRTNKSYGLPQVYILPDRKLIARGPEGKIILPISKVRFLDQENALVWALEISYETTSFGKPLQGLTVKDSIANLANGELDKCISPQNGSIGLASFFKSNSDFEGFNVGPNIAGDILARNKFETSVNTSFEIYHKRVGQVPNQLGCSESLRGLGLIGATALSLKGWILPQVFEYIK